MSSYKVPQDVEADDKLLGPFSFRQFVYLMIVAVALGVGFLLFKIFAPLAVIALPFVVFFGALALPLRKDQPMEIYMAALLSFYLKPRNRMWDPDGIETLIQIAAPRNVEPQRTKNISSSEAEQRLRYLSNLSDTHGWSVRGIHDPSGNSLNADIFNEAQQTQDLLDNDGTVAQNLNHMISQADQRRHQEMLNRFQSAAAAPAVPAPQPVYTPPDPYTVLAQPTPTPAPAQPQMTTPATAPQPVYTPAPQPAVVQPQTQTVVAPAPNPFDTAAAPQFNPYPSSMNQTVIQPLSAQAQVTQPQPAMPAPEPQMDTPIVAQTPAPEEQTTTSTNAVSPDIIKLASNTDLSVETIAREAHRISEKSASLDEDEVVISLR
ncbi:MAG TPA: PrgI family protein [Candidatus Saccharibacteria bacterium]|nr:PrgI family protein [Candidatus Saccharibacteria bacterium]